MPQCQILLWWYISVFMTILEGRKGSIKTSGWFCLELRDGMCIKSSEISHLSDLLCSLRKRWQLSRNQVRLEELLNDRRVREVYCTASWGVFMLCGCPRWRFCLAALFLSFTDSSLLCHSDRFRSSREWGMDSCVQFLFRWLGSPYSWYRLQTACSDGIWVWKR